MLQHFGFLPFEFVDDPQKIRQRGIIDAMSFCKIDPRLAIRHAHDEVTALEAKREHRLDRQRDQLGIRLGSGFAKDIDIELMKLTAATLLRFLVTKALADLKPLERLGEMTLMLGRETRQRCGHFRAQCHIASALILKAKQLR